MTIFVNTTNSTEINFFNIQTTLPLLGSASNIKSDELDQSFIRKILHNAFLDLLKTIWNKNRNVKWKDVFLSLCWNMNRDLGKEEIKVYSKWKPPYYNLSLLNVVNWNEVIIFILAFYCWFSRRNDWYTGFDGLQSIKCYFCILKYVMYHIHLVSRLTRLFLSLVFKQSSNIFLVFSRNLATHRQTLLQ